MLHRRSHRPRVSNRRDVSARSAGLVWIACALTLASSLVGVPLDRIVASWHGPSDSHQACGAWQSAQAEAHDRHDDDRFEAVHDAQHRPHGTLAPATGFAAPSADGVSTASLEPPRRLVVERHAAARSVENSRCRGRAPPQV